MRRREGCQQGRKKKDATPELENGEKLAKIATLPQVSTQKEKKRVTGITGGRKKKGMHEGTKNKKNAHAGGKGGNQTVYGRRKDTLVK